MSGQVKTSKIKVPIAKCNDLTMTENDLPELLQRANHYTINIPYHNNNLSSRYFGSILGYNYVNRPNDDGTHSTRQLRFVEILYDLIAENGNQNAKNLLNTLTEEKKINLKLAAYFARAGRMDNLK